MASIVWRTQVSPSCDRGEAEDDRVLLRHRYLLTGNRHRLRDVRGDFLVEGTALLELPFVNGLVGQRGGDRGQQQQDGTGDMRESSVQSVISDQ
jgi:hypothetical protein